MQNDGMFESAKICSGAIKLPDKTTQEMLHFTMIPLCMLDASWATLSVWQQKDVAKMAAWRIEHIVMDS